jgi:hypothetical protein
METKEPTNVQISRLFTKAANLLIDISKIKNTFTDGLFLINDVIKLIQTQLPIPEMLSSDTHCNLFYKKRQGRLIDAILFPDRIILINLNQASFKHDEIGNWFPLTSIRKHQVIRVNIIKQPSDKDKYTPYYLNAEVMIIGKNKNGLIGLFDNGRLSIITGIFVTTSGDLVDGMLESTVSVVSSIDKITEACDYSWQDVKKKLGRSLEKVKPSYDQ